MCSWGSREIYAQYYQKPQDTKNNWKQEMSQIDVSRAVPPKEVPTLCEHHAQMINGKEADAQGTE